jgi:hypothetical protein
MKRFVVLGACALVMVGCSKLHLRRTPPGPVATAAAAKATGKTPAKATAAPQPVPETIERVPFRAGVSSATVEKMAREMAQCTGGLGAGLVSEPGPVEVYRMACDNGTVFMARCEMRQCQPMKR